MPIRAEFELLRGRGVNRKTERPRQKHTISQAPDGPKTEFITKLERLQFVQHKIPLLQKYSTQVLATGGQHSRQSHPGVL